MSALLTLVHVQGPTTRAALTTALGLNRSTIGDLTGRLEELGLVTRSPSVAGSADGTALTGGRSP